MVKVKVLRPFNATPQGELVDVGDEIEVTEVRAGELALLGLAERVSSEKAARTTQNKMAPEPENKGDPASAQRTVPARTRRGNRQVK